ncbi:HTH-type transcriptional regulator ArgP [Tepidicella baoligensis]|uniref:HTH-type transcriptional regulator ArgP n=1 Tax=Tepidicella baoligensis TaxID=2707016 RepID=UPI0015D9C5C2|nr:HTH-type transcriptional regulator ArgP [Tepidicella baoligensis]
MLDARQLEALAAVVEQGGFSGAAKALSLTVAAVSLRIKSLEEALGQRLLVRGKRVRATPAGQALLTHVRQVQLMEADLLAQLADPGSAGTSRVRWQSLSVAINADSVASWFLPGVAPVVQRHHLLIDILIDDQDHTHDALKSGEVTGCVSTLAQPMRGCVAEPLGIMRYRCVATPALAELCRTPAGRVTPHRLLSRPAIIFNRKDALQDVFLHRYFQLREARYPRHFTPAIDAFETAIELGMGWGMVPELHLQQRKGRPPLVEVLPDAPVDVALYWHHWEREPATAQRLTQAVKAAAAAALLPPGPNA